MTTKYIALQDMECLAYYSSRKSQKPFFININKDNELIFIRQSKKEKNAYDMVTDDDEDIIIQVPKDKVRMLVFRKYFPIKDELYETLMSVRIKNEPSFIRCFKHNITDKFINSYKMIVSEGFGHRQNNIIFVSGQTGTGKSISSISLCKLIYKDVFSYKNIFFFDQQILDNVDKFPPNSVVIRDENPSKGNYGIGSKRIETQVDVIADTCRKHGLSLIFIEPEFRKSDIAKFYLETIDYGAVMDCDSEGKPIKDQNGNFVNVVRTNRIGVREPKSAEFMGGILIPIIDETDKDWIKYNEVKDQFISNIKSGKYGDAKLDVKSIINKIANNEKYDDYRSPDALKLLVSQLFPNITTSEIGIIMTGIKLKRRGINIDVDKEAYLSEPEHPQRNPEDKNNAKKKDKQFVMQL